MTTSFQQTNTDANSSALADLCSGNTSSSDKDSNQADDGGSAGSTERTHTPDNSAADLNGVWMEIGNAVDIDDYDGASGNWTWRINITTENHQLTLDEVHICRVNSSYVNQEILGSSVGIGEALGSAGVKSGIINQASGTTITAGDKIIVIFAFDNAQAMTQSFGYTPDQIITAPGTISGGTIYDEDIALAVSNRTSVPITILTRVGLLTLAITNRTLVPISALDAVGALTLGKDKEITPISLLDTNDNVSFNKILTSAWIGNILTPQALILAISNRTASFVAGLSYADSVSLAITNRTSVPIASLTRIGEVSLGKDKGISFVSQLDAVETLSFGKDLDIFFIGTIDTSQNVSFGKNLGLTLDGNIITSKSLTLGKDKGISIVAGLAYSVALALAKDAGLTLSANLTRLGTLSLNKDKGMAITAFLTRVGNLALNKAVIIAIDGSLIVADSLSLARNLGLSSSNLAILNDTISMAKVVTFIPTATVEGEPSVPHITGNINLIEQAEGNIILVETPTGIIVLDLTP